MNEKERVALSSVGASAALTIAKGVVGLSTGSLAILSEAAHSLIDFAATLMTYFAVRIADKPADAEHHYGHGDGVCHHPRLDRHRLLARPHAVAGCRHDVEPSARSRRLAFFLRHVVVC